MTALERKPQKREFRGFRKMNEVRAKRHCMRIRAARSGPAWWTQKPVGQA